jgi:membrane fusion protein, multidrug efflux system
MSDGPPKTSTGSAGTEKSGAAVREQASSPGREGSRLDVPSFRESPRARPKGGFRRLALPLAGAIVLLVLIAGVAYWRANAGLVKTDNAQTAGDVAPISSRITGTVIKVDVSDNQYVTAGTALVELDLADYQLALDRAKFQLAVASAQVQAAEAALAAQEQQFSAAVSAARAALQTTRPRLPQAQAQVTMDEQTTAAQIEQAKARVTTARAGMRATQTDLETVQRTLDRDRQLFAQGAISAQQVDTDTAAYESANAQAQAARDALTQAEAMLAAALAGRQQVTISRNAVEVNRGEISQAEAQLQQAAAGATLVRQRAQELAAARAHEADAAGAVKTAELNLSRTIITAPADGWVTNRTVEIGQVVQPNQPLLSLTLAHRIWVVANIKETQVGRIRIGDPVRVRVDEFRGRVFRGHVESIGAATGSTTALLPPDNATGNFVKVVQLVPVKISLDPDTDPERQLQVGLSAEVAIDTRHRTP